MEKESILKIRNLIGLASIDPEIYSVFFPKSKSETVNLKLRVATSDQKKIAFYIKTLVEDCKLIKSELRKVEIKKPKLYSNIKFVEFNYFILDWKINEIIKTLTENRAIFFDYFEEAKNKDILERFFSENELLEGINSLKMIDDNVLTSKEQLTIQNQG